MAVWNGGSGLDGGPGYEPPAGAGKHAHLNGGRGLANVQGDAGIAYESGWVAANDINIVPTNSNLLSSPGYCTWTPSAATQETLPISCVNWWEAYAFCIWDGGFLPSEAEFVYAAAGGNQQREYPWGATDPGSRNQFAIWACYYPPSAMGGCALVDASNVAPVGTATLGAGRWGQLDLGGNVNEWTMDSFNSYISPCTDCAYLIQGSGSVFHGGSFYGYPPLGLSATYRGGDPPSLRFDVGFRCARTP